MELDHRATLRREAYDLKEGCIFLAGKAGALDADAARAIQRARYALFDAWTLLCNPPEEEDDHDH